MPTLECTLAALFYDLLYASRKHIGKWALIIVWLVCSLPSARAEYRIEAGDVIEIFVTKMPDLQRRVSVKLDGTISFPLLGTLLVAGLSQAELQTKVQAILATKVFQQRASDGQEIEFPIDPDAVIASVVEYRPIYVNGDVAKPGEYAYRPFATVRQAVALSGGYDVLRMRMANPFIESADFRSDYAATLVELAKEQARIWRIKSELGYKDNVDRDKLMDVPLPRDTIAQIIRVEADHLAVNQADYERQKAFLEHSIKQGEAQIGVLSEQGQKEAQGAKADAEELQRAIELLSKGLINNPRLTDARRAILLSSTRKLQIDVQLMQMKKQQDELARQLEKLDDQRKIDLLQQLQDAAAKVSALRARLQGVTEKLRYTAARTQLASGAYITPTITVIRKGPTARQRISADEDFELQPGDVVEVTLADNAIGNAEAALNRAGAPAAPVTAARQANE